MRTLGFLIPLLLAGGAFAQEPPARGSDDGEQEVVEKAGDLRLLLLDAQPKDGAEFSDEELEQIRAFVLNGLRGKEGVVIARDIDVERRAPLQADRLGNCFDAVCFTEMTEALDADYLLYGSLTRTEDEIILELGLFERRREKLVELDGARGINLPTLGSFTAEAMERILKPLKAKAELTLFERPSFLGGAVLTGVGLAFFAGSGGWALEMESNLADPDKSRALKEDALQYGPTALMLTGIAAGITVVGIALLAIPIAEDKELESGKESGGQE